MTQTALPAFAGRVYRFEVDNGYTFRNRYSADGQQLHWEAIAGPSTGQSETVALKVALVAPHIYFVSWTEASTGMTVSHVMDLERSCVHAFWTYGGAAGERIGALHGGTLTQLDG